MTTEPLSPSAAPVEAPIKSEKKGIQLEWVRRASVVVGVALLFIIFWAWFRRKGITLRSLFHKQHIPQTFSLLFMLRSVF